jgi:hypothetical protein
MSHFAKVIDGIVETVHVVEQDYIDTGALGESSNWIQTSYNTRGGVHYAPNSGEPDGGVALRKNYAGKGYTYDESRDAFIAPKPYPSWILDNDTCVWNPPTPEPEDSVRFTPIEERKFDDPGKKYYWDEPSTSWQEVV